MSKLLWLSGGKDENEARRHLTVLCRGYGIEFCSFKDIPYGGRIRAEIQKLVRHAHLILVPLSVDFLNSEVGLSDDSLYGLELAMERHRAGDAYAVRVLVRPCRWGPDLDANLRLLDAIPSDGRALHPNRWQVLANEMQLVIGASNLRRSKIAVPCPMSARSFVADNSEERMVSEQQHEKVQSASRTSTINEGHVLGGRYKLVARLGLDTISAIWRAINMLDGRVVTVHLLRSEITTSARMRIFGYMAAIAKLAHPAILRVVEPSGTDDKQLFYYVVEMFEAATLRREALRRPIDFEEVVSLVWHIGGALAVAHAAGIAHGDIRPANLLADGLSPPRLTEFQVLWDARSIHPMNPGAFEAHLYAAPELYGANAEPTPATDVYSLCLTALFCLRGSELPDDVSGLAPAEEASFALGRLIDELACPGMTSSVLKKAASLSPSDRYKDAEVFRAALLAAHREVKRGWADMAPLRAGSFLMGDDKSEYKHDKPVHTVHVSAFELGKYEVTQRCYRQVMLSNPSYVLGDELPVNRVTFFDAIEFCNRLSILEGLTPSYRIEGERVIWDRLADGYRLPTEAEWEYAARGSEGRVYPWGSGEEPAAQLSWSGPGNDLGAQGHRGPSPVGSYPGGNTPEGLTDMAGNVWEWCWDWYEPYRAVEQHDPEGPPEPWLEQDRPPLRALRGAAWNVKRHGLLRASTRSKEVPSARDPDIGFRVACNGRAHRGCDET
jgi:formylglycine-generating enzyme required for sulfatase activity